MAAVSRLFIAAAGIALACFAAHPQGAPSAFGGGKPAESPGPAPETKQPAAESAPASKPLPVAAKLAQLMLVTLEGEHQPSSSDFEFLKQYTPAGVIVDHAISPQSAQAYVARLRGAEQLTGVPFWIGANLYHLTHIREGSPSAFPQIPSALALGAAHDPATARQLATLITAYMAGMGFNLHLGPSLSLAPTHPGAMATIHTLGGDAAFTAVAAKVLFGEFRSAGLRAIPAGFPGGGFDQRTGESAVLSTPREQLESRDFAPFLALLHDGADILHVDTTVAPTLDRDARPACLSADVMQGLLKDALGFKGLIVAGPLDAPEMTANYDAAESALLALRGGADLLYWQTNPTVVTRVVDKLASAVKGGLLEESVIDRALMRVIEAKTRAVPKPDDKEAPKKAETLSGRKDLAEIALGIERQSITLLRNRNNLLPLEKADGPIGVTGVVELDDFTAKLETYMKPIAQQEITTAQHLGEIQDFEIQRLTKHVRGLRTAIVVITDDQRAASAKRLVQALKSQGCSVVAVVLGYPALAAQLSEADAIVLGYCKGTNNAYTMQAIAEMLMGEAALSVKIAGETFRVKAGESRSYSAAEALRMPAGRLPVDLGEEFPLGSSVSYIAEGAVKSVEWDFGDGTVAKEATVEHTFAKAGSYTITLRTVDLRKQAVEGAFTFVVE